MGNTNTFEYESMLEENPDMISIDGHDTAIIGIGERLGLDPVLVYDEKKIVHNLMAKNDWNSDEAYEFYEFNIKNSYVGPRTPIFLTPKY